VTGFVMLELSRRPGSIVGDPGRSQFFSRSASGSAHSSRLGFESHRPPQLLLVGAPHGRDCGAIYVSHRSS